MKQFKQTISISALVIFSLLVISCSVQIPDSGTGTGSGTTPSEDLTEFETSQGLKKFSSPEQLTVFLKNVSLQQSDEGYFGGIGLERSMMSTADSAAPMAKGSATDSLASGANAASEYSQTNIQVAGVDEADIVKNDGKHIYTLSQNKLVIVDAYPAENAEIVSEIEIKGNPRNLFVNKDRLIVFVDGNDHVYIISPYDYIPYPRYTQKAHALIYDISDRSNPKLAKDYNLNGYYVESRMIGDHVYFIVQENVYYYRDIVAMPEVKESATVIARPEVFYFDNPEYNYNFNTIASFNVFENEDKINAKTFMMGYSNTIYVSENNIYITYQKSFPYTYYRTHNEERFYDVVLPLLPSEARNKINEIRNNNELDSYEKGQRIASAMEEAYNKMDEDEKQNLIEKIQKSTEEYEARLAAERAKTVVHKIKIDKGNIEYGTKGEVPGYLLNQFSLDEHNNNLRVATTTDIWAPREHVIYNNVYVLDEDMDVVGKLEAIAKDERIYSARFIGDRLYMVTFKNIDPFFVIDLSNPENPQILGELKIPGFSDYLHPYDENHIIGIGKETEGNEWGGVSVKGVKLALFDVSDVKNPKPVDKYEIGSAGTDSEALRDHKAFLFDKNKNLLVIPVTEVKGNLEYDSNLGYYRQRYWQGAYVFNIDLNGFEVKGKITHNEGDENQDWYWYGSPNAVRRSLFMDDVLYTVSGIKIKANDLNEINKEIKEIKLPYEKEDYPYPVPYKGGVGIAEPRMVE